MTYYTHIGKLAVNHSLTRFPLPGRRGISKKEDSKFRSSPSRGNLHQDGFSSEPVPGASFLPPGSSP